MERGTGAPLRVALIGYGLGGSTFHAPLIAAVPALRLAAVVTADAARQARVRAAYPDARTFPDAPALWREAAQFDVAVVCTPNRTHAPLAIAALQAGLHVVVDKPFTATIADAERVIAEARRNDRVVTVYQNRRWDGDFLTLMHLVRSNRLGRIMRFESRLERWSPTPRGGWRESTDPADAGGILYDLGSHLIDQALTLFGPAASVHSEIDVRRAGAATDDDAFVAITHANGVRSHLYVNRLAGLPGPRFRVLGDRAAFLKFGMDPQEPALRAGRGPRGDAQWGREAPEHWGSLGTQGNLESDGHVERIETMPGAYQNFYAELAVALANGASPPVDPEDALRTHAVIDAARRRSGVS